MKKLLFFVTEDWYFVSHRLDLAVAAKNAGYNVTIVTQVSEFGELIKGKGLNLVPIKLSRSSINPISEFLFLVRLYKIYNREAPDIVHQVTFKPVIYGTLVSRLLGIKHVVNALAGLGFLFRSDSKKARFLKNIIKGLLKITLKNMKSEIIVQNPDDLNMLRTIGVRRKCLHLIKGAGVDVENFFPTFKENKIYTVLIATRMLWDKGVDVFVSAIELLKEKKTEVRAVLVGGTDEESPNAIPETQLLAWHKSGIVEWWGKKSDMPSILNQADVVCLPSNYGEGIPKVLIEAAACGKPIITTDTPGCREIVENYKTGLLVPVSDVLSLANAIEKLTDVAMRLEMGQAARKKVVDGFTKEIVIAQTLSIYRSFYS